MKIFLITRISGKNSIFIFSHVCRKIILYNATRLLPYLFAEEKTNSDLKKSEQFQASSTY